jgi:hypothetical protein
MYLLQFKLAACNEDVTPLPHALHNQASLQVSAT